ncbi:FecR domain-containing protein [Achromobacter insuavis]
MLGVLAAAVTVPALYALSRLHLLADYRTGIGERRRIVLADGSALELGSDTALSVHFDSRQRQLTLHRGQAYFQVAADAARRFSVRAGQGSALRSARNSTSSCWTTSSPCRSPSMRSRCGRVPTRPP